MTLVIKKKSYILKIFEFRNRKYGKINHFLPIFFFTDNQILVYDFNHFLFNFSVTNFIWILRGWASYDGYIGSLKS